MKSNIIVKTVSVSLLLVVLAGLLLAWPGGVAHAITENYYDYCIVSGSTDPLEANGTYFYDGTNNSRPVYTVGDYSIYYQLLMTWGGSRFPILSVPLVISPGRWVIEGPDSVWYFSNPSSSTLPPSSGWGPRTEYSTGTPIVTCGYETPSDPAVPQPTPEPTKSPITYVFGDGRQVNLSCQKTLSFGLVVPGGDIALLSCPVAGLATNDKLGQDELPAGVTGGTFVSAFDLEVSGGGAPLSTLRTPFVIAFKIPEGVKASQLAILFWDKDNNQWVELPTAVNLLTDKVTDFGSGRKVIVGTHQYTRTHVAATVNFTGIFVLIQK